MLPLAGVFSAEPVRAGESFWSIGGQWQADSGEPFTLQSLANGPTVVAMFYTGCHVVCPTTVETMHWLEHNLSPVAARHCHFLLVTMDPGGDSAEELRAFRTAENLSAHWTLLRTSRRTTRTAADWLGVRFESSAYHISHGSVVVVLDSSGQVVSRHSDPGADLQKIREELERLAPMRAGN